MKYKLKFKGLDSVETPDDMVNAFNIIMEAKGYHIGSHEEVGEYAPYQDPNIITYLKKTGKVTTYFYADFEYKEISKWTEAIGQTGMDTEYIPLEKDEGQFFYERGFSFDRAYRTGLDHHGHEDYEMEDWF